MQKRQFHRWDLRLPGELYWRKENQKVEIVDISFGGARIRVDVPLPIRLNSEIGIRLQVDQQPLTFVARLVYVAPAEQEYYLGVQFRETLAERRSKLIPLLRQLAA